jgi:transposase
VIPVPSGVRVWLATGVTDMRRGMNGLTLQVQEAMGRDPYAGDLFVFRGRRGNLIKVLWHGSPRIRHSGCTSSCPGTGRRLTPPARWPHSRT